MGAPCVSSAFWLVYQRPDLSEDSYCMLIITGLISVRARLIARGTVLSSTAADFRTWGDVSARRRAEPN